VATIMNDIQTYADEMFNKFVMAQIPMSDFDGYVNMIKRMGVDKATDIWQKVIDRYNAK
jgi:putative aldouronate transport system substrate-binding protein